MLKVWFKIFYRTSKKNWLNTIINICGLALGLIGLIIVLLYYNEENAYDAWNSNKNIIYKVGHAFPDGQLFDDSTHPEGPKCKEVIPEIEDYFTMPSWYIEDLLETDKRTFYSKKIVYSTPNFFNFFPHPILEGDKNKLLLTRESIVISNKVKTFLFGSQKAVGKTIKFGKKNYIVSGVYKLQKPSTLEPEAIVWETTNKSMLHHWGSFSNHTYYKIKKGSDIQKVEKKILNVFIENNFKEEAQKNGMRLESYMLQYGSQPFLEKLSDFRLKSKGDSGPLEGKGNYFLIVTMLGLSVLIIIISCINFINLSFASASLRGKEVGIKKTLGTSVLNFKIQYIIEVCLQGLLALFIALVAVELILPSFNTYFKTQLSLRNAYLLIKISILTIIICLLIGTLYATYLQKFKTTEVLKGNYSKSKKMILVRNFMLGTQFIISGFFVIGGIVVYSQVKYMHSKDLGFSGKQIVAVKLSSNEKLWNKYQLAKKVFKNEPDILEISTGLETPGNDNDFSNEVKYKNNSIDTKFIPVDYGYFKILKTKMQEGRAFSKKFASDSTNAIILNETAVKRLNISNPIHKKVHVFSKEFTIIGVVKDYHVNGFDKEIRPIFYLHYKSIRWLKNNMNSVQFKLRKGTEANTLAKIERFWKTQLEPKYPFVYHFVDKQFKKTIEKYEQQQTLFFILTIVVIMVALLGLFALATLTIQQKLKEVAIKKALGASIKEIITDLIKNFVKIVIVASIFLIPISYFIMQQWLNNFAYRINMPISPYIIAPIVLIVLVIGVVGIKAYKAAKIDLIKYLKFE
ncbi:ABC transporter permease [Tenacibaculum sp. 190524A02b]|uniref:ABC transporter permease n=1 Tax=Tenacibaculum vairaonense TaxID=3137860 RepID=UPI0031FAEA7B